MSYDYALMYFTLQMKISSLVKCICTCVCTCKTQCINIFLFLFDVTDSKNELVDERVK